MELDGLVPVTSYDVSVACINCEPGRGPMSNQMRVPGAVTAMAPTVNSVQRSDRVGGSSAVATVSVPLVTGESTKNSTCDVVLQNNTLKYS